MSSTRPAATQSDRSAQGLIGKAGRSHRGPAEEATGTAPYAYERHDASACRPYG